MRRLYTLLPALFLLAIQSGYSQSASFGLRGGVTAANLRGDATQQLNNVVELSKGLLTPQSRTGFHAGAYVTVPVAGSISLEPGLYYSQKGYQLQGDFDIKALDFLGANASATLQSTYIDAPILVKANLVGGLNLFAGPQISYLVKNNLQVEAGALGLSLFKKNIDVTDNFKQWDMALTGGVSYEFPNGLNIQAAYDHGLSRIDANSRFKTYNSAVKLGVGFRF